MNGLATRGLVKRYGTTEALRGLDLEVPAGSIYGLVGPNGSGKTTALEILVGLRRPTAGSVDAGEVGSRIVYCPDAPEFDSWLTAAEVIRLSAGLMGARPGREAVEAVLARVGLENAAGRKAGGFSRGMLSRLNLAAALICEPTLLVADEPAAALDPAGRWEIIELLGKLAGSTTVIVSSHDLHDVQRVCDHVGILTRGSLAYQGTLRELLERAGTAIRVVVREPSAPVKAALAAASWVRSVQDEGPGTFLVEVSDPGAAEEGLPVVLASCGARLVETGPAEGSLQDIFFQLTGTGPARAAEEGA